MQKPKYTTETFIEKAREIHGYKYDYSKVEYINYSTKVCIICPEHGEFLQDPAHHLKGNGCPICAINSRTKWTYEACFNIAKYCKTKSEFKKKSPQAYTNARINGWLKDYTWFEQKQKPSGYWDSYEHCYEEAKKYISKSDFQKNCNGAYTKARINGWLKDYTWLKSRTITENTVYIVYCYVDEETNSIYVGITNDVKRRHKEHCKGHIKCGKLKYDVVYTYFKSVLCKEIPEPIILHENVFVKEAQEYEKKYVDQFKIEGKNVLNIAKTGSLGAYSKWTIETCYNEALKYKGKCEFYLNNPSAYNFALKHDLLKTYTWFEQNRKPSGYWDCYEHCYEEAKKYTYLIDFRKSVRAYFISCKNGWINDFNWLIRKSHPKNYWTFDNCVNTAKICNNITEFMKAYNGGYKACQRNGWIKKLKEVVFS